jgi:hypothetical protein
MAALYKPQEPAAVAISLQKPAVQNLKVAN